MASSAIDPPEARGYVIRRAVMSDVEDHVVLMPMQIKMQWEGKKVVAVMPGWRLPTGLIVEGDNTGEALDNLKQRMLQYWGEVPPLTITEGE